MCKTVISIKMYAALSSINWMFVEGMLLHSRITTNIFRKDAPFKLYYLIGWGKRIFSIENNQILVLVKEIVAMYGILSFFFTKTVKSTFL